MARSPTAMPMLVLTVSGTRDSVELEGLTHHGEQAFGDEVRGDAEVAAVDQYDELVAAHPADRVGIAQRAPQSGGDGYQQLVAGLVPERVVDVLELVEIDVRVLRLRFLRGGFAPAAARSDL